MQPVCDLYASRPHYADHAIAVWRCLPREARGTHWGTRGRPFDGHSAPHLTLVASLVDAQRMAKAGRPVVVVEHGAGQLYTGDPRSMIHGSYAGGQGYDHARLFLAPSERVAQRWRAAYQDTPVAMIGSSPLLDWVAAWRASREPWPLDPLVGLTWHWDCDLIPETRSARGHYQRSLGALREALLDRGRLLVVTGHPRATAASWRAVAAAGVHRWHGKWGDDSHELLTLCDVLLVDNSSLGYEAAAMGVRTVWLNAPWYRRDVDHGLRFWSHVPGPQVDDPAELIERLDELLVDTAETAAMRARAMEVTYPVRDGASGDRAAAAILEVL